MKEGVQNIINDTVLAVNDTIKLDLKQQVILPDNFTVHTISQLTGIEYVGLWIAAIAGIIAIFAGIKSIRKLFKKDDELQSQINELVKLNQLFEKRVRMTVKPHLWTNGSGYNGTDYTIHIQVNNRGQIGFYTGFEVLEGKGGFNIQHWNQPIPIEKNEYITLSGTTIEHPKKTYFKIKIKYFDKENYAYETIIEWNEGKVKFLETTEL